MTDTTHNSTDDKEEARSNFEDIIGKPALLRNEDPREFFRLEHSLREIVNPQNIIQEMQLRDLTNMYWEAQRLKHNQIALVESSYLQALIMLLAARYGENHEQAMQDATDYFSGDAKKKARVEKTLETFGITAEHIEANAMHLHRSSVYAWDTMIARRETGRNSLFKYIERQQRKAAKRLTNKQASNGHSDGNDLPDQSARPKPFGWVRDAQ